MKRMTNAVALQQVLEKLDAVESQIREMKQLMLPTIKLSKKEMAEIRKAEREIQQGKYFTLKELRMGTGQ